MVLRFHLHGTGDGTGIRLTGAMVTIAPTLTAIGEAITMVSTMDIIGEALTLPPITTIIHMFAMADGLQQVRLQEALTIAQATQVQLPTPALDAG